MVRPPALGAALQSVDENSVKNIPGLVKIVHEGNFVGVVAETEWGAIEAAQNLRATWSRWDGLPEQKKLYEHIRATKINKDDVTSNIGNVQEALPQRAKTLKATYDFAIHTHGSIGPSCAIAEIKDGQLTCWTASQATHNLKKQLAAMLNLPVKSVRCIYVEGSGCYGRNGHEDAAGDAALLARAVGRPVRVQWMRADEHGWDPKGPPTLIDLRAVLDGNGDVVAWESEFFIPKGAAGNVPLIAASLAGLPHETAYAPGNIIQNSAIPYAFPNIRTVCHRLAETPFRPSWIRTPGRMQNTYANEAFIDELAAAAGADPLDFRLKYLKDPRGIELLQRLAALSKWGNGRRRKRTLAPVMLALGFTLVYGILELINVAALQRVHDQLLCRHVGSRVSRDLGPEPGPDRIGAGRNPGIRLRRHNDRRRRARRRDRTLVAAAIARRPRHGGDDHDDRRLLYPVQHHPLTVGAGSENYPNPMPVVRWQLGEVTLELKELLIWGVAVALMVALHFFVNRTRLGKAMRATAQDAEAARMMGVDVDRVIVTAFFLGSALAGAAALIFGLYYNYTSFIIGYTAGLRAFTAAVLGGIGSIPGAW